MEKYLSRAHVLLLLWYTLISFCFNYLHLPHPLSFLPLEDETEFIDMTDLVPKVRTQNFESPKNASWVVDLSFSVFRGDFVVFLSVFRLIVKMTYILKSGLRWVCIFMWV